MDKQSKANDLGKVFAGILLNGTRWAEDYKKATGKSPWQKEPVNKKKAG